MSPREKRLALLSVFGLIIFVLYYIPIFIYATLILVICCFACYYLSGEPIPARLGPNPRAGLNVPAVLRRWLSGWGTTGVSVAARGRTRSSNRPEHRETEGQLRQRPSETGVYRREALASDSFLFSPRDFLMGSYIAKAESPTADSGRPRAGRNPREQLREKLSRPNHAVYTPNRRLSFTGEPLGTASRFTITPQRHYPLQQPGVSSVGVLPPVKWDGFRKKNVLSPRNAQAALSPVTVKIARPDHNSPSLNHLRCAGLTRTPADPCSRESVLKVLKESRKREVEDEDRSFATEQKSKRRRNDSGGSSHSAFDRLLPNGTPSQLVPKPGSLKRGMTSMEEESTMKRSRTSSISSGSVVHFPRGTSGTKRNAIQSSYSSSAGLSQWKKPSTPSSPLSSPESSRSQTPEGVSKRPREDDTQSPSSASSVKSDHPVSEKAPDTSKQTPVPKVFVTSSTDSTGSGGKRKRKIQLVSSHRDDHISLPPPPELGYSITAKDLDEEKKAAISKIQKVLETPAPEPEKSVSPAATTSSQPAPSTTAAVTTTLISLLTAPLPTESSSAVPVINLDPSPSSTAPIVTNPLLETLEMGQPSAFTQMLGQVTKAPTSTPSASVVGPTLFGLSTQVSIPSASTASTSITSTVPPASCSESVSNTNPLLAAGFKPIFPAATTSPAAPSFEIKTSLQNFKSMFGDVTAAAAVLAQPPSHTTTSTASTPTANTTSSVFGASLSTTTLAPSSFSGFNSTSARTASSGSVTAVQPAAQTAVKSPFGNWSTPPTTSSSSTSAQPRSTESTFQFGAAATPTTAAASIAPAASTTTSSTGSFAFGITQSDPQASSQKIISFSQTAPGQNTTTASFGSFPLTNSTAVATSTTQSTFALGKPAFEAPAAQLTFSSSATPKPFPFVAGGTSSVPASNPAPAPFAFRAAATTDTSFTTPAKPAFGASFAFGANSAPSAVPSAALSVPSSFGAATQTQSPSSTTFTFGGAAPQQAPSSSAQPAPGAFNFSDGMPRPQFGTPVLSNPAPQMGAFNFGAAASDQPGFGTSALSFGQGSAAGPIPFRSPGTPAQGFNPVSFGSPATPTFSIGAGSKPPGSRQRLQARRLHNRKK